MLAWTAKLTQTHVAITIANVDALREAGFSDRDTLDIPEVFGYYAYAYCIAEGLGFQTEPWIPDKALSERGAGVTTI